MLCAPGIIEDGNENKSFIARRDLLYIGTLVAHHLLSHLEAARPELRRPHLLSAVTLPLAGGFFGYRLVTYNLCGKNVSENQQESIRYWISTFWCQTIWKYFTVTNSTLCYKLQICIIMRAGCSFREQDFLLTSTKFPEYTSSSVTSRSSMMSFPLGMFLSCCCRFPPNMNPKSPKKLQEEDRERVVVASADKQTHKTWLPTIECTFNRHVLEHVCGKYPKKFFSSCRTMSLKV